MLNIPNIFKYPKFPIVHIVALAFVFILLIGSNVYQAASLHEPIDRVVNGTVLEVDITKGGLESTQSQVESNLEDITFVSGIVAVPAYSAYALQVKDTQDHTLKVRSEEYEILSNKTLSYREIDTYQSGKVAIIDSAEPSLSDSSDDSSFVIQFFGSYEQVSAQAFVETYSTHELPLRVQQAVSEARPWYIVVSGHFLLNTDAKAAVIRLPAKLKNQSPWVRSI